MALIHYWECGKQISDQAKACPHCGAPQKKNETASSSKEISEVENKKEPLHSNPTNNTEIPATHNTSLSKPMRIFLFICVLIVVIYFLVISQSPENSISHTDSKSKIENFNKTITNILIAGEWDKAIKTLKAVPKNEAHYKYSQEKLNRLLKGHSLFKNARGRWKCETDGEVLDDCLDLSGNTVGYNSKFNGNTWYVNYNIGKGWEIDKRYIDYLDNGHLLVAGFIDGKIEDKLFEIWQ